MFIAVERFRSDEIFVPAAVLFDAAAENKQKEGFFLLTICCQSLFLKEINK